MVLVDLRPVVRLSGGPLGGRWLSLGPLWSHPAFGATTLRGAPSAEPFFAAPPKISLFRPEFRSFFLSVGVFSSNCGRGSRPWPTESASLGFSGVILCEPWRTAGRRVSQNDPREVALSVGRGRGDNSTRRPPRAVKKNEIRGGREKKNAKFWALHRSGPHPSWPPLCVRFGPLPLDPPLRASTLRGNTLTFSEKKIARERTPFAARWSRGPVVRRAVRWSLSLGFCCT